MLSRSKCFGLMLGTMLLPACRSANQPLDPEYVRLSHAIGQAGGAASWSVPDAADFQQLAGARPVDEYIQFALQQNPEIQAARNRLESLSYQVPVAASLQDPMLGVTALPAPVQTAAGRQDLIVTASQKLPWFGKLDTQAGVAEAHAGVARAEFAAVELATIARVKQAYYELYYVQQAITVTEEEQQLLAEIRQVAEARYRSGGTSQQDVLRADLEISNVENDLIRLRQLLVSGQARLASVMHAAPRTQLAAVDQLSPVRAPQDLEALQQQAVVARPELHARLAAIERDRRKVDLARLDYRPDFTLGASWISVGAAGISPVANGRDAVLVSAGVNLPIYRKRLAASVRSAEAQAVSSARDYDALRDVTLEEVTNLFAQARSQYEMLTLFEEDILPKARQTLDVSSRAYNVGEVDFLQLVDNWRQLLRYELTYRRLEANLRQSLAELERVVGGFQLASPERVPPSPADVRELPAPQ